MFQSFIQFYFSFSSNQIEHRASIFLRVDSSERIAIAPSNALPPQPMNTKLYFQFDSVPCCERLADWLKPERGLNLLKPFRTFPVSMHKKCALVCCDVCSLLLVCLLFVRWWVASADKDKSLLGLSLVWFGFASTRRHTHLLIQLYCIEIMCFVHSVRRYIRSACMCVLIDYLSINCLNVNLD